MLKRCVQNVQAFIFKRCGPAWLAGFLVLAALPALGQTFDPTLDVGAGIRTSYEHYNPTDGSAATDQFAVNDARIYISGDITKNISGMLNTDYSSTTNNLEILDAVGEIHTTPMFNVWFGRFLPPSDRANLYGPFYANEWDVYTDGVQDGFPSVFQGRDNGIAYWGDFKAGIVKMKLSTGVFDGFTADGDSSVIWTARAQFDFWDAENGYYLNGTYYGDKNLLAIAGATQVQGDKTATTVDFLLEKKVLNGGAVSIESEYSNYNRLGGYDANHGRSQGGYGLASLIFPKEVGIGKFEVLGKYAVAQFTDGSRETSVLFYPSYRQNTAEANIDYVMKQFDARLMSFYKYTSYNEIYHDYWEAGIGLQVQLSKQVH